MDTGTSLARLEHGEAHIAFRAGPKPETLDYVVKLFQEVQFGLYASRDYINRNGKPAGHEFEGHRFVGAEDMTSRLPYAAWMKQHLTNDQYAINASDPLAVARAVKEGIGIGFPAEHEAVDDSDLVRILPFSNEWSVPIWIVTHVDLHRTEKIQAFLSYI
ncbi:substrate-binding domain-containing protein [Nereida ignava]|nr:substrate-binding domain-containing protein [Nereida ignava]